MFSPWDEHPYKCQCQECLELQRAHEEMMKDMTWEKYSKSIKIDMETSRG